MNRVKTFVRARMSGLAAVSPRVLGVLVIVFTIGVIYTIFQKERIATTFRSTDTVVAEFARDYKLDPYRSDVKIAGVVAGTVSDVEMSDRDTTVVSMEIDEDAVEKLGDNPSAAIRPTLLLGGRYYVELVPNGDGTFDNETIPLDRTKLPVELDRVLSAFTPSAREATQRTIDKMDATLDRGGRDAVRSLLKRAPNTLNPAGDVLRSARGTRPERDLTDMVTGLRSVASALTKNDGQLDATLKALSDTSATLAAASGPVAATIEDASETLRVTRAGLVDLRPTLDQLTHTAEAMRPTARELDYVLAQLDPALVKLKPLLADLRPTLAEARPLVERLVPTSRDATAVMGDVRGPVLDRVNGPILDAVTERWSGTGSYRGGGGNGHRTYEELGYLMHNASSAFGYQGPNGTITRLTAGYGINTAGGSGMTLEKYLEQLGLQQPPGPQPGEGNSAAPGEATADGARSPLFGNLFGLSGGTR